MLPRKLVLTKILDFFLYHQVEDGLNFLQANFGVNKIAKIMVGLRVQDSFPRC